MLLIAIVLVGIFVMVTSMILINRSRNEKGASSCTAGWWAVVFGGLSFVIAALTLTQS